jgi:sigma-B regulation protein RsbQ
MSILKRNNVTVRGRGDRTIMFVHGFGCDQNMWRFVAPQFEDEFQVVLLDLVGAGQSDLSAYSPAKYASLEGYAEDIVEICRELGVRDIVFVGHSVSAMIGVIAARMAPELFSRLVLVGPSPRYIDEDGYRGGFTAGQIEELLAFLDSNHLGWSEAMAPTIMGNPERPELGQELTNSFCRTDPEIAKHFARVTFLSDHRSDVAKLAAPALILQCSDDLIAPRAVGDFMARTLPRATLRIIENVGHCPHLSAPSASMDAIDEFLAGLER